MKDIKIDELENINKDRPARKKFKSKLSGKELRDKAALKEVDDGLSEINNEPIDLGEPKVIPTLPKESPESYQMRPEKYGQGPSRPSRKIIRFKSQYILPDKSVMYLQDEEELNYVRQRNADYLKDFKWNNSSDAPLLSRLLILEIEFTRAYKKTSQLQMLRSKLPDNDDPNIIKKSQQIGTQISDLNEYVQDITEEIRDLQKYLGIARMQRKDEGSSPVDIMIAVVKAVQKKLKEDANMFYVTCPHCKETFNTNCISMTSLEVNTEIPEFLKDEYKQRSEDFSQEGLIEAESNNSPEPVEGAVNETKEGEEKNKDSEEEETGSLDSKFGMGAF